MSIKITKKDTHINRNKLNELKISLSSNEMQIFNILSKNIFPKSIPKIDVLVENINSLNEKSQKKNRFNFKITSEMRNELISKYLDVFPQNFQNKVKEKHSSILKY